MKEYCSIVVLVHYLNEGPEWVCGSNLSGDVCCWRIVKCYSEFIVDVAVGMFLAEQHAFIMWATVIQTLGWFLKQTQSREKYVPKNPPWAHNKNKGHSWELGARIPLNSTQCFTGWNDVAGDCTPIYLQWRVYLHQLPVLCQACPLADTAQQ